MTRLGTNDTFGDGTSGSVSRVMNGWERVGLITFLWAVFPIFRGALKSGRRRAITLRLFRSSCF
jgi:hypothetical protein